MAFTSDKVSVPFLKSHNDKQEDSSEFISFDLSFYRTASEACLDGASL